MVKKSLFARLFNRSETAVEERGRRTPSKEARSRVSGRLESAARPTNGRTAVVPEVEVAPGAQGRGVQTAEAKKPAPAEEVTSVQAEEIEAVPTEELESDESEALKPARGEELKPAEGPPVQALEMSKQEELNLKLKEGFQGISSVLNGIDRKIDHQKETSSELMVQVRRIPDLIKEMPDESKAGLELLATISTILDSQGRATSELLGKMGELPKAMAEMETRFQDQARELAQAGMDARETAVETRDEVGKAFTAVKSQVNDVKAQVKSQVDELSAEQTRRQEQMIRELRRQRLESDRRVDDLIKRSGDSTKVVVFLLVVVIAALLLVVKQFG